MTGTAARPLPPETVYLPFETGPYRMTLGLTTVPETAWFEIDRLYPAEMAERRQLLAERHADVFAAEPVSLAARAETLRMVSASLCRHHPGWFSLDSRQLRNGLTGETWDFAHPPCDPLELAGRLVQEDLCLVQMAEAGPVFTAGVLCFPSRWRLREKIGRQLAEVHGPVPLYANRLARPVDRFMEHVKAGPIASRLNWSVVDDPALFQPAGKWRVDGNPAVTAANAGQMLWLRVERQTLRRLPETGAVLFGIRVHGYRLDAVIDTADRAENLAAAVRALPEETGRYKSLPAFQAALLGWLDGRADPVAPA